MSRKRKKPTKPLQWRLECFGHSLIECLAGLLPGSWLFRVGEMLGGIIWHFMPLRRQVILRNLRIAFAGELEMPQLRRMAKQTFCRTAGNLICTAHIARLSPKQLSAAIHVENINLLEQALSRGKGVVLLLAHMGNWEALCRLIHFLPKGTKAGAFYRPLNNPLLDKSVLARRQADGSRMFSKRDPFHQVTGFLRDGGVVGVLADQRIGIQGEVISFFGRLTRSSPLPSLLARRAKSEVLALSLECASPGKWSACFYEVKQPHHTVHCVEAMEHAMQRSPLDVFWLQERWKLNLRAKRPISSWLGAATERGNKPHRALIWLAGVDESWRIPETWFHPDVIYEVALIDQQKIPAWLPASTKIHTVGIDSSNASLSKKIEIIDFTTTLPLDFILAPEGMKSMIAAGTKLVVPVVLLPFPTKS